VERFRLGEAVPLHQDGFGAVDQFASLQLLLQFGQLAPERLGLGVTVERHAQGDAERNIRKRSREETGAARRAHPVEESGIGGIAEEEDGQIGVPPDRLRDREAVIGMLNRREAA
jgi:hypothetical protein